MWVVVAVFANFVSSRLEEGQQCTFSTAVIDVITNECERCVSSSKVLSRGVLPFFCRFLTLGDIRATLPAGPTRVPEPAPRPPRQAAAPHGLLGERVPCPACRHCYCRCRRCSTGGGARRQASSPPPTSPIVRRGRCCTFSGTGGGGSAVVGVDRFAIPFGRGNGVDTAGVPRVGLRIGGCGVTPRCRRRVGLELDQPELRGCDGVSGLFYRLVFRLFFLSKILFRRNGQLESHPLFLPCLNIILPFGV